MFHWLFAGSFAGAYLTADIDSLVVLHMSLGYLMIGLLGFRLMWGIVGPKRVRISSLYHRISAIRPWVQAHKTRRDIWRFNWHTPQNALMAAVVALLLAASVPLVLSGYLTQAHLAWRLAEDVHESLAGFYLGLAITHVVLLVLISLWRTRNLAMPMVSGHANGPGPNLVRHHHTWLAVTLLVAALGWMVYFVSL
jgi:cytochrome b